MASPVDKTIDEEGDLSVRSVKRCNQCYQPKPEADFIGSRGKPVTWCSSCRDKYRNWSSKTPEEKRAARPPITRTGNGSTVRFTMVSKNRKTGEIPVSSTDMASCPPSCPHMDHGCYAGYGKSAAHWRNVARDGMTWSAFCKAVSGLSTGQLWRHNEAGDLPGLGSVLDMTKLRALVRANKRAGARGFTFTHLALLDPDERRAVLQANLDGFTINLSADSPTQADAHADLCIGPVALVLPVGHTHRATKTPAGRQIVICPNETSGLTCKDCQLCAHPGRKSIIGFIAHGQASALVSLRVKGKAA